MGKVTEKVNNRRTFSNKMPRHTPSTRSIFNWKTQYIISIEMYVNQI
uniref:Uncharacterized protein n=1 Tax=Rhizophora mucronata TaxID=61149 RepID=A0A2P2KA12_RHIMU